MTEPTATAGEQWTPDVFRSVMGRFVTGVSVMTSTAQGEPHGMTANAVTSVSLDPPLVLVCVDRAAVMADVVSAAPGFALTFLAEEQRDLSQWFSDASRPPGTAQFAHVDSWTEVTGSPILAGGHGWLDCRLWATYDGGDHLVVVGEVVALGEPDPQPPATRQAPLAYYGGRYARLALDD